MTGYVYVLCLDPPRGIGETDLDVTGRCQPISHYVGWTGQDWPMHHAGGHGGAGMISSVLLMPGTLADEERLKAEGRCPRCGKSLDYRREHARAIRAERRERRLPGRRHVADLP